MVDLLFGGGSHLDPPDPCGYETALTLFRPDQPRRLYLSGEEATTFLPLETRDVLLSTTPSISWNQIHIIGMKWTGPFTFQRRYDQALRRLHPERGFDSLVTQLEQICSYARMDLAMRRVMA